MEAIDRAVGFLLKNLFGLVVLAFFATYCFGGVVAVLLGLLFLAKWLAGFVPQWLAIALAFGGAFFVFGWASWRELPAWNAITRWPAECLKAARRLSL